MPRDPPVTRAMRPAKAAVMVCSLPGRGLGCSPGRSYESTRVIANRRPASVAFAGRGSYPQDRSCGNNPPAPILPRHRRARNVMPNFRPFALFCSISLVLIGVVGAQEKTAKKAGLDWGSLQKLSNPSPPQVHNPAWLRNPIDAFILANLEARGLSPAPPADRAT